MIIACPACSTRYVVPDSAIGVDGRTVRCAKCRHSWHQDGPELDLAAFEKERAARPVANGPRATKPTSEAPQSPAPSQGTPQDTKPGFTGTHVPTPPDPDEHDSSSTQSRVPEANSQTEDDDSEAFEDSANSSPPPLVDTGARGEPEPAYDDEYSQFDYEPPFRPRRNPLKIWTAAGALFAVIALGTVAAVSYYGLPDWIPISRPTFAAGQPDLLLDFPADQQDRRSLPDGSEFFSASGKITNVGRETRQVPSILIVMRDERERIVYSWEVPPSQASLAPGEEMTINEIVTKVPKSAKFAEIGWKPS